MIKKMSFEDYLAYKYKEKYGYTFDPKSCWLDEDYEAFRDKCENEWYDTLYINKVTEDGMFFSIGNRNFFNIYGNLVVELPADKEDYQWQLR